MGSQLYTRNTSSSIACLCLQGDPNAQAELQKRLGNDLASRRLEIGIVVDTSGAVMGTGGRSSGIGTRFNPQNLITEFYRQHPGTSEQVQKLLRGRSPNSVY